MSILPLTATPLYAGTLALIYVGLSIYVIRARLSKQIGLGTADDPEMLIRTRIHGNFAEYVQMALALMLALELAGTSAVLLHVWGILLVGGRLAHAYGLSLSSGATFYRTFGMISVFFVLVTGGICAIFLPLGI
jgi:uncharacterized membrane protein YecN with MAPEG domain